MTCNGCQSLRGPLVELTSPVTITATGFTLQELLRVTVPPMDDPVLLEGVIRPASLLTATTVDMLCCLAPAGGNSLNALDYDQREAYPFTDVNQTGYYLRLAAWIEAPGDYILAATKVVGNGQAFANALARTPPLVAALMVLVRASRFQKQAVPRRTYPTRSESRAGGVYRGSGSETIIGLFPSSVRTRRPPIVYCHGGGGFATDIMNDPLRRLAQGFLEQGFPILSADLGIPFSWGNDDSLDAIGDAIAYAGTTWGTRTDQVALWGDSHGAVMALITAARFPSRTPFVFGQVPVVGLPALRANPAAEAPFGAGIDAAYGGNPGYLAALPTHDPSAIGQTVPLRGYGDRLRLDADLSDIYCLPAMYDTFMGAVPQADFRWFHGIHFYARYHDRNELGRWAASMADAYS